MNKASPIRWFASWRSRAVRNDDWADLGTAFGLEMSMMDAEEPALPAPVHTKQRSAGWVRRLTTRRRAAV